jgi:transposase-like protein
MGKKRWNFTAQFKFETVIEGIRGEKSVGQIGRERDITESLYYKWRDAFLERGASVFKDQRVMQRDEQTDRVAELERLVGKQTLELEILKKAGSLLDSMRRKSE